MKKSQDILYFIQTWTSCCITHNHVTSKSTGLYWSGADLTTTTKDINSLNVPSFLLLLSNPTNIKNEALFKLHYICYKPQNASRIHICKPDYSISLKIKNNTFGLINRFGFPFVGFNICKEKKTSNATYILKSYDKMLADNVTKAFNNRHTFSH